MTEVIGFCVTLVISNVLLSVWRIFFPISRILEQSVLAALVSGVTVFCVIKMFFWRSQNLSLAVKSSSQFGWAIAAAVLVSILFFWMVVNSIDRSNSFFLINWLGESNTPMDLSQIKDRILRVNGSYDFSAVKLRLVEHERRGIVIRKGNDYELSALGRMIYLFAKALSQFFSLSGWKSV